MKKIIICTIIALSALSASAQEHFNVGVTAAFNGPGYNSGTHPAVGLKAEYLLPYGIRAGVGGSYFYRSMPSDYHYSAWHMSLRGSCYIKSLLGKENPRWDFYAGSGIGYHRMRYTAFEEGKVQFFVPVFAGADWRFAPKWHLAAEIAYNDVGAFKLIVSRRF